MSIDYQQALITNDAVSTRPRVTFFVHDLAGNAIVRAAPLATALAHDYDVEILGLLISGTQVYAPYQNKFHYRTIHCRPFLASILAAAHRLAKLATGTLLYACKPLPST